MPTAWLLVVIGQQMNNTWTTFQFPHSVQFFVTKFFGFGSRTGTLAQRLEDCIEYRTMLAPTSGTNFQLPRESVLILCRSRTGHCQLGLSLHWFAVHPTTLCSCSREESVWHYLFYCTLKASEPVADIIQKFTLR